MRKVLAVSAFCAAANLIPAAAASAQPCTVERPMIGSLEISAGGPVAIYRGGDTLTGTNATPICLGDESFSASARGAFRANDGTRIPFAPGEPLVLPKRERLLARLLTWLFKSPENWRQGGSPMNEDGNPGISLLGVEQGSAILGARKGELAIPLRRSFNAYQLDLVNDATRKIVARQTIGNGQSLAILSVRALRRGRYTLLVNGKQPIGSFSVADISEDHSFTRQWPDRLHQSLAFACLDVRRNSLEAVQRFRGNRQEQQALALLLTWQHPTAELSCSTPT